MDAGDKKIGQASVRRAMLPYIIHFYDEYAAWSGEQEIEAFQQLTLSK